MDEQKRVLKLLVPESEAGQRVDLWLRKQDPTLTRRVVTRLCDENRILQNGRPIGKAEAIFAQATISVLGSWRDDAEPAPDVSIDVLVETNDLLVINKQAGVPCAAVPGSTKSTLAGAILSRYPEVAQVGFGTRDPALVHRLDTHTSGLIIAARHALAFERLRAALVKHQWDKRYLALVAPGTLPDQGVCRLPLGPDPNNKKKVRLDGRGEHSCTSAFNVQSRGSKADLVEVRAHSAYRHQVRAHLASLGAPLIGDTLYGGQDLGLAPRHALHASYIAIPTLGLTAVTCALPDDLAAFLDG